MRKYQDFIKSLHKQIANVVEQVQKLISNFGQIRDFSKWLWKKIQLSQSIVKKIAEINRDFCQTIVGEEGNMLGKYVIKYQKKCTGIYPRTTSGNVSLAVLLANKLFANNGPIIY